MYLREIVYTTICLYSVHIDSGYECIAISCFEVPPHLFWLCVKKTYAFTFNKIMQSIPLRALHSVKDEVSTKRMH